MESAIFRLKSSLEGVNQNNPLIFLPRIKSLRMFVIFPRKCLPYAECLFYSSEVFYTS